MAPSAGAVFYRCVSMDIISPLKLQPISKSNFGSSLQQLNVFFWDPQVLLEGGPQRRLATSFRF